MDLSAKLNTRTHAYIYTYAHILFLSLSFSFSLSLSLSLSLYIFAKSGEAVEYNDCISAEKYDPSNDVLDVTLSNLMVRFQ